MEEETKVTRFFLQIQLISMTTNMSEVVEVMILYLSKNHVETSTHYTIQQLSTKKGKVADNLYNLLLAIIFKS